MVMKLHVEKKSNKNSIASHRNTIYSTFPLFKEKNYIKTHNTGQNLVHKIVPAKQYRNTI